jgi:hypothetical protein
MVTTEIDHLSTYAVMASTYPAEFSIAGLSIVPGEITAGETTTVSVTVTNTGDLTGDYEAILRIDGAVRETSMVTVDGGASQTASFSITQDAAGEYTVSIGNLSGTLAVKEAEGVVAEAPAPPAPAPAPAPAPPAAEKPVTPTPAPAPAPEEPAKEAPVQPESNWYWWLIGAVIVVIVVVGLLYQFRWRKQKAS